MKNYVKKVGQTLFFGIAIIIVLSALFFNELQNKEPIHYVIWIALWISVIILGKIKY